MKTKKRRPNYSVSGAVFHFYFLIRQMAEKIAHGKIQVVYDIPVDNQYGYAPDTGLRLSGKKLMALGWEPKEGIEDMFWEIV